MEKLKIERGDNKLIVIRQTLAESVLADLSTISLLIFFIGIGVVAGSFVMELLGAFIAVFFILLRSFDKKTRYVTPDQAVDIILAEFPKKNELDISV